MKVKASAETSILNTGKYIVQLDGLRFFAVTTIMLAHWCQWQWTHPFLTKLPLVHGVDLFFVLSGFLITRILLSNREEIEEMGKPRGILLRNFYIRRFLRIFPIYYLLIIGLFLFNYANTRELFPWLISYTSNIYQSIYCVSIGEFNHFWSLAVEEQFYLFWPLLMLFIPKARLGWMVGLVILLSLATKAYFHFQWFNWMANTYSTITCMHLFGLGALLALLKLGHPETNKAISKPIWAYLSLLLYVGLCYFQTVYQWDTLKVIFDDFLFGVVSFFIIAVASENGFAGLSRMVLENPLIVRIGKISYGIYIIHLFIPSLFYYLIPKLGLSISNKWAVFFVMYGLAFLIASLSWTLIEQPINRLKEKFGYV